MIEALTQVFSIEEEAERFRFQTFCTTFFDVKGNHSETFECGIKFTTLLDWYKIMYPDSMLTEDIIAHQLYFGGFIKKAKPLIFLEVREDRFRALPVNVQENIISLATKKSMLRLSAMLNKKYVAIHGAAYSTDASLNGFFGNMLFTKRNSANIINAIKPSERHVVATKLYDYYVLYCKEMGFQPIGRRNFYGFLEKQGIHKNKGYYGKVAGVTAFLDVVIPTSPDDMELSLHYGVACITINNNCWFNDGTSDRYMSPDGFAAYIQARKERIYGTKGETKEETKEEGPSAYGNVFELPEDLACSREEETTGEEQAENNDADDEFTVFRDEEHSDTRDESNDAGVGLIADEGDVEGDYYEEPPMNKKDVIAAFKVIQKMHPDDFSIEVIASYLTDMNTTFSAEEIYSMFV